jgi:transcriptional regulator with XRE-family HTH domain
MMGRSRPAALARDRLELGKQMKAIRGKTGLRKFEEAQDAGSAGLVISRSQLSRYEQGKVLAPLKYAEHLDHLYDAGGWVDLSLKNLWRPRWNPWADEFPALHHYGLWPALHHGLVWVKVKPTAENIDCMHALTLEWGPWGHSVTAVLPAEGIVLVTGKAVDDEGTNSALELVADRNVFALFGAGEDLDGEITIDIHRGWVNANN